MQVFAANASHNGSQSTLLGSFGASGASFSNFTDQIITIMNVLNATAATDMKQDQEGKPYVLSTYRFVITGIGLILLGIVGIVLNTIVATIFTLRYMRIGVNVFLACLAVSDALYLVTLVLNQSIVITFRYFVHSGHLPAWITYIRLIS